LHNLNYDTLYRDPVLLIQSLCQWESSIDQNRSRLRLWQWTNPQVHGASNEWQPNRWKRLFGFYV